MKLYLIRHGLTEANAGNVIQGHQPTSLNDIGRQQARQLAGRLAGSGPCFDRLIASDLPRAAQTAEIIAQACHCGITYEPQWRERCFGTWEGTPKPLADIWSAAAGDFTPPGAESTEEFRQRIVGALLALPRQNPRVEAIAVVTHGGPCRMILGLLAKGILQMEAGMPRPELATIANCSIMHLQCTGQGMALRWQLLRLNDVDHLEKQITTSQDAG